MIGSDHRIRTTIHLRFSSMISSAMTTRLPKYSDTTPTVCSLMYFMVTHEGYYPPCVTHAAMYAEPKPSKITVSLTVGEGATAYTRPFQIALPSNPCDPQSPPLLSCPCSHPSSGLALPLGGLPGTWRRSDKGTGDASSLVATTHSHPLHSGSSHPAHLSVGRAIGD
jgi:hypothetical protein